MNTKNLENIKLTSIAHSKESKAQRSSKILEIALHEFFLNGFKATRMGDVARGAGITKGAL